MIQVVCGFELYLEWFGTSSRVPRSYLWLAYRIRSDFEWPARDQILMCRLILWDYLVYHRRDTPSQLEIGMRLFPVYEQGYANHVCIISTYVRKLIHIINERIDKWNRFLECTSQITPIPSHSILDQLVECACRLMITKNNLKQLPYRKFSDSIRIRWADTECDKTGWF